MPSDPTASDTATGQTARKSDVVGRGDSACHPSQHDTLALDGKVWSANRVKELHAALGSVIAPATEIAWMKVVVKNEALAVRRARTQLVPVGEVDVDGSAAESQHRSVD